jgi:hypothetical protein
VFNAVVDESICLFSPVLSWRDLLLVCGVPMFIQLPTLLNILLQGDSAMRIGSYAGIFVAGEVYHIPLNQTTKFLIATDALLPSFYLLFLLSLVFVALEPFLEVLIIRVLSVVTIGFIQSRLAAWLIRKGYLKFLLHYKYLISRMEGMRH